MPTRCSEWPLAERTKAGDVGGTGEREGEMGESRLGEGGAGPAIGVFGREPIRGTGRRCRDGDEGGRGTMVVRGRGSDCAVVVECADNKVEEVVLAVVLAGAVVEEYGPEEEEVEAAERAAEREAAFVEDTPSADAGMERDEAVEVEVERWGEDGARGLLSDAPAATDDKRLLIPLAAERKK